jgi:hypothetical protein
LKEVVIIQECIGLPDWLGNTRPWSSHREPNPSRSSFWAALWYLRASTARAVSLMLRRLLLLFVGVNIGPFFVMASERCTESLPASKSMSSHRREKEQPEQATELTEHETKSARAYSEYLAVWASKRDEVTRFRDQVLNGRLLSREEALALVTSQAAAIFSLSTIKEKGIPLAGHVARAECKDWGRRGDRRYHCITVYVEPPGIELSREIYERISLPQKHWFPFEYIDEEGNINRVEVRRFSMLDRLRKVSNSLARNYPWEEVEAAHFVLTGEPPKVSPLWGRTRDGTITLTAAPWVSEKTVSRFYRHMQRQVRGGNNRPLTDRSRAVLLFVSEHWVRQEQQPSGDKWVREGISWWRPSWSMLHELWNVRYPEWEYEWREELFKAYQRAHRVLLSKDPPRSW